MMRLSFKLLVPPERWILFSQEVVRDPRQHANLRNQEHVSRLTARPKAALQLRPADQERLPHVLYGYIVHLQEESYSQISLSVAFTTAIA
jgi:hypothetical protein